MAAEKGTEANATHSLCRITIRPKKTSIATCPPTIFAKSLTHSAKGFTKRLINSTGTKIKRSQGGTPEGIKLLKYPNKPLLAIPAPNITKNENHTVEFVSENVKIKDINYYFSNSISRASKTMSECRQIRQKIKKTGTDN